MGGLIGSIDHMREVRRQRQAADQAWRRETVWLPDAKPFVWEPWVDRKSCQEHHRKDRCWRKATR